MTHEKDKTGTGIASGPTVYGRPSSDAALAAAELRQDPLHDRLTRDQRQFYVERGLALGGEAAREYRPLAGERIAAFAERLGCRVRMAGGPNEVGRFSIRTEYRPRDATIIVYRRSVRQMLTVLRSLASQEAWTVERVEDVHLAHEVFHHLEATRLGLVNERLPKVITFEWGPLVRRTSVRRAREIAAHKFAKDALQLPFMPNLIDVIDAGRAQREGVAAEGRLEAGLRGTR